MKDSRKRVEIPDEIKAALAADAKEAVRKQGEPETKSRRTHIQKATGQRGPWHPTFKRSLPWVAMGGAALLVVFIIAGSIMSYKAMLDLAGSYGPKTQTMARQEQARPVEEGSGPSWADEFFALLKGADDGLDAYRAGDGDQSVRAYEQRMAKQEQFVKVMRVQARQAVEERRLTLIETGDDNGVPYAVLIGLDGRAHTCQEGEVVSGARVMGVFPDQVVLMMDGMQLMLGKRGTLAARGMPGGEVPVEFIADLREENP